MTNRIYGLAFAALAVAGCAAQPAGQFTTTGYQNPTYSYSVGYSEGALVMPSGWVLDNFLSNPQGLVPRKDAGYMTAVHLDRDGDRVPDGPLRIPVYDLRFVHGAHPGVIWLRTFPYSYHLHEKPIEQLARDYVAYMAAQGIEAAVIDDRAPGSPQVSVAVDAQASWMVAGHPAEVLEIHASPMTGGVPRRARVVIVRPGFMYQYTNQRRETVLYPVVMVAGYSNSSDQFEAAAADFDALLGQITVQGVAGLTKGDAVETGAPDAKDEAALPPAPDEATTDSSPEEEAESTADAASDAADTGAESEAAGDAGSSDEGMAESGEETAPAPADE